MSFYSDKLAQVQVVINCPNIDAQMCTRDDGLAYISGAPSIDDIMSYSLLTTQSLDWGVIFLSLQHLIASDLNLIPCLPSRQRREAIKGMLRPNNNQL